MPINPIKTISDNAFSSRLGKCIRWLLDKKSTQNIGPDSIVFRRSKKTWSFRGSGVQRKRLEISIEALNNETPFIQVASFDNYDPNGLFTTMIIPYSQKDNKYIFYIFIGNDFVPDSDRQVTVEVTANTRFEMELY